MLVSHQPGKVLNSLAVETPAYALADQMLQHWMEWGMKAGCDIWTVLSRLKHNFLRKIPGILPNGMEQTLLFLLEFYQPGSLG